MVDRIACFLTCGYTEAGAMQFFLKKMNSKFEYKQYLPNKTIKKKGDPKSINSKISGLTGDALLEKIYSILEKNRDEIGKCKAVLIEDDLDGKFHGYSDERIEVQYIENNVLKEYTENIEEYGWFLGKYIKLSDCIINAVQTEIKEYIQEMPNANKVYVNQIVASRDLYYSKKLHGDRMMRNIQPDTVAAKCRKYFGSTYNAIVKAEL